MRIPTKLTKPVGKELVEGSLHPDIQAFAHILFCNLLGKEMRADICPKAVPEYLKQLLGFFGWCFVMPRGVMKVDVHICSGRI